MTLHERILELMEARGAEEPEVIEALAGFIEGGHPSLTKADADKVMAFLEEYFEGDDPDDDDESDCDEEGGPSEEDLVTKDYVTFYSFGGTGKPVVTFDEGEHQDWMQAVRAYMEEQQFWPDVWCEGERGGFDLLDLSTGEFAKG